MGGHTAAVMSPQRPLGAQGLPQTSGFCRHRAPPRQPRPVSRAANCPSLLRLHLHQQGTDDSRQNAMQPWAGETRQAVGRHPCPERGSRSIRVEVVISEWAGGAAALAATTVSVDA